MAEGATHVDNFANKRRFGFTLAEVLITLGIIGVVAALTLPAVITKYQKQVTVNKIKKFYTNINTVLGLAQAEYGEYSSWEFENSMDFYNKYIKPYIKNVDKVDEKVHIHGDFTTGIRFVFADGTQAFFSAKQSNYTKIGNTHIPTFIFDMKAQKHSNVDSLYLKHPTRERFYFIINDNGFIEPPHMNSSRSTNIIWCGRTVTNLGTTSNNGKVDCSTVIFKDGWKISDDYPW